MRPRRPLDAYDEAALIYLNHARVQSALMHPNLRFIVTNWGSENMRHFRSLIAPAFLALAAWTATVNPSRADTGTVRVVFGAAGVVVGAGNGKGMLTFHGRTYPFEVSGVSFGPSVTLTVSVFEGRAMNLHTPGDLAGNYLAIGVGGAIVGGIGVARLRNAKGVVLVVRGPKMGAGISANVARVTIAMM